MHPDSLRPGLSCFGYLKLNIKNLGIKIKVIDTDCVYQFAFYNDFRHTTSKGLQVYVKRVLSFHTFNTCYSVECHTTHLKFCMTAKIRFISNLV